MRMSLKQGIGTGAVAAVLTAPMASGLIALAWQFPIVMAGTEGHSLGALLGATISMALFMTLFSFFGGVVAIAALGGAAGYVVRDRPGRVHAIAGVFVGILAALGVAAFDASFI